MDARRSRPGRAAVLATLAVAAALLPVAAAAAAGPTDEEASARTVEALFLGGTPAPPLDVEVEVGEATRADGVVRVPVTVRVPLAAVGLVAESWAHSGSLTVYAAAGGDGVEPRVVSTVVPVRLGNDEILAAVGRRVEHTFEVELPDGATAVAVGLRDDVAGLFVTARRPLR